jgi:diguanylate cyclase (GGDEF)-like protein
MATEQELSDVLSEFARTMATDFPIERVLEQLIVRVVEILPVTAAGVTLISPATGPIYAAASDEAALGYAHLQSELDEGPCLAAYRTGNAVAIADLRDEKAFKRFTPRALEAGLAAVFNFPLHRGEERFGVLELYRDTPGPLDEADTIAAETLADVTAAYLVNAEARSHLQQSTDRAAESSMHDALTGLPNRVLLLERVAHALRRSGRSHTFVAVLFVDLDGFTSVNDVYGHHVGDQLLIAVGRRITGLVRPGDTIARLSGDEFVIMCEDLEEQGAAEVVAGRIVDALQLPFDLEDGVTVELSASVGCACASAGPGAGPGEDEASLLVKEADIAMYQVKRRGGADHLLVERREQRVADYQAGLTRDLGRAVGHKELRTEYQPVVRTSDGRVIGAEALLRWDHPVRGVIPPTTVIALAEQSGDIVNIGRWVLEQACTDRHRWASGHGDDTFEMAVNISAHELVAPGFTAMVADVLARTATDPSLLTLEITESAFIDDAERALVVLTELKGLGVRLALDDFGTGYSSLNYLKRFPVDVVKLDQSFIAELTKDKVSHAIVSTIIELAHRLELSVVSEGVETAEQRAEVALLGAEYCQGFYFARPISADDLDHLMHQSNAGEDLCLPAPLASMAG